MDEESLIHSDLSFLLELENYSFESKMLACQKFASRIMSCSKVDMQLAYQENIMPWELEVFSLFSVVYDNPDATEQLTGEAFGRIITLIRNYWHPELTIAEVNGVYSDYYMMISTLQQFPVQGVFLQKLFRYDFFFSFSNEKLNMKQAVTDKFENDYRQFELFAFIMFVCTSLKGRNALGNLRCNEILKRVFSIGTVRKQLSIDKEEYIRQLNELYHGNLIDYYYGLKIQYQFPIVEDSECGYIPSPYLVINAVTESLLNRLTFGNSELRRKFGKEVVEEYLYSIYKELNTVTWISREFEYHVGRDKLLTPDVLVEESERAILFDTKALAPSLRMRKFDAEEIEHETMTYSKDIFQLYCRICDLKQGNFSLQHQFERNNVFGVVVVLEDAALPRQKVYDRAFDMVRLRSMDCTEETCDYIHSHIKIVPLRQIEEVVLDGYSYMDCLLGQVEGKEHWDDYSFFVRHERTAGGIPMYNNFVRELKSDARSFMIE